MRLSIDSVIIGCKFVHLIVRGYHWKGAKHSYYTAVRTQAGQGRAKSSSYCKACLMRHFKLNKTASGSIRVGHIRESDVLEAKTRVCISLARFEDNHFQPTS